MSVLKNIFFVVACSVTFLLHADVNMHFLCYKKNSHAINGRYQCTGDQVVQLGSLYPNNASVIDISCMDENNHSYHPSSIQMTQDGCVPIETDRKKNVSYKWDCNRAFKRNFFQVSQIICENKSS